jgi:hypothetical protein
MLTFAPNLTDEGADLRVLIEDIHRLDQMKIVDIEGLGCPEVCPHPEQLRWQLDNPRRQGEGNPP